MPMSDQDLTLTNPLDSPERQRDVTEDLAALDTQGEGEDARSVPEARERKAGPFGGLSAREAALRSAAAKREKREEREAEAELDKLTVHSRVSVALARSLPYAELVRRIEQLCRIADGNGATAVQAARELRGWLGLIQEDRGEQPEDVTHVEDLSPAQRAVVRARILRELGQEDESPANE